MGAVAVQFVGSGDAFGSGGRFNTCIMVSHGNDRYLMDCGASSLVAMRSQGVDPNSIRAIFITHLHGDHFGGLPFFLLDAQLISRRAAPLLIAGPPGLRERLTRAQEALYPGSSTNEPSFDLTLHELAPGAPERLCGVEVTGHEVSHPCGAPPLALRLSAGGKTVGYSGDTAWCDALTTAADGCDLFAIECCFFDKSVRNHLCFTTIAEQRAALPAKRIVLTHMGADMLARVEGLGWEYAEDGKVFEV